MRHHIQVTDCSATRLLLPSAGEGVAVPGKGHYPAKERKTEVIVRWQCWSKDTGVQLQSSLSGRGCHGNSGDHNQQLPLSRRQKGTGWAEEGVVDNVVLIIIDGDVSPPRHSTSVRLCAPKWLPALLLKSPTPLCRVRDSLAVAQWKPADLACCEQG